MLYKGEFADDVVLEVQTRQIAVMSLEHMLEH